MSKPANTVAVGAFVAGAFLILFMILFSLSGSLFERNVDYALVVFDGSLKGLSLGAPVALKGVPIGEVVNFGAYVDADTLEVLTPVVLRISRDRIRRSDDKAQSETDLQAMVDKGVRAELELQSLLTGLVFVQLDFYPGTQPRYAAEALEKYDIPDDYIIIPTIPKGLDRIARSLEDIDFAKLAKDAEGILSSLHQLVSSEESQAIPGRADETLRSIEQLADRLKAELEAVSPDLNQLVTDAAGSMATLNKDLPVLSKDAQKVLEDLAVTLETARKALQRVDYTLSDDSALIYDLRQAASEIGAAGRALQSLAESLDTHPESLIKGKRAQ